MGIPIWIYAQVWSEWAPKGNKFLSACRNVLCTVGFLRRSESEQKGNHSEASAREICSSGISWRTVQLLRRSEMTSQRWIKNPEFETMNENIQLTRLDHEISRINPESRINPGSQVNPENWFNPEIRINLDSRINIRFKSSLRLDQLPRLHWHDQRKKLHRHDQRKFIIKISKWLDPTKMLVESNPGSRINPRTRPDQDVSRFKSWKSNQS